VKTPRLLGLLLLVSSPALAQVAPHYTSAEAAAAFEAATSACLKEDSTGCFEGYERLRAAGFVGADLEYNLGTAHLMKGHLGRGILHLERALRLDPGDEDARANLETARRLRVDKLVGAPEETGGAEPLTTRIVSHTRAGFWSWSFLFLWTGGGLLLVLRRLGGSARAKGGALLAGAICILLSVPAGGIVAAHAWARTHAREAVVVAERLPVRQGPRQEFEATFEVHEGLKVQLGEELGAFRQIRLSNGLVGWVPAEGVEEIVPR